MVFTSFVIEIKGLPWNEEVQLENLKQKIAKHYTNTAIIFINGIVESRDGIILVEAKGLLENAANNKLAEMLWFSVKEYLRENYSGKSWDVIVIASSYNFHTSGYYGDRVYT